MKIRPLNIFENSLKWAHEQKIAVWAEPQTSSTNDEAKKIGPVNGDRVESSSGPLSFALFLTSHQSVGRGRGKHVWQDGSEGCYLLSSWRYELPKPPQHLSGPLFGWALYKAAQEVWPEAPWSLKAPNDLYLHDHKVAGLLLESVSQGGSHWLIVGLGVNVLAHPEQVEGSGSFCPTLLVNETLWWHWLGKLKSFFDTAAIACQQHQLDLAVRQDLLNALNAFPKIEAPIIEVTEDASLVTADAKIDWSSL